MALFLGIFLMGILLVPGIVQDAEAEFSDIDAAYTIVDDETGGSCNLIGTWDWSSKTCTLTGNVNAGTNHGITISSNNITLDGAGYTITGDVREEHCMMSSTTDCGTKHWMMGNAGIWVPWGTSDIVIKNVNINGFHNGILTRGANNLTVTGNTISSPGTHPHGGAIDLSAGYGATISDNTINNSYIGIFTYNVRGNNQCTGSSAYVIEDNIISGIEFGMRNDWNVVGNDDTVGVCIQNNTITGATSAGIWHYTSKGGQTTNNNISNSGIGIQLTNSQLATVTDNSVTNSSKGVLADSPSSIFEFSDNTVTGNGVNFDGISQAGTVPEGTITITAPIILQAADSSTGAIDPTGGDCTQIGTWDASTLTCKLTADVILSPLASTTPGGSYAAILVPQTIEYVSTTGITIDGNGHTITGFSQTYGKYGVELSKTAKITVKNLILDNFYRGISTSQSYGVTITENTIRNSAIGINAYDMVPGTGLLISNNSFQNTSQHGIMIQGFEGTESCSGDVSNAFQPAHSSFGAYPVIVKDNTVTASGGWGISITGSGICVDNNTITGVAMYISGDPVTYSWEGISDDNNIISNNSADGIVILSDNNIIDNNTSNGGSGSGFKFHFRSQNNVITNNVANDNNEYGFYFDIGDGWLDSDGPGSTGHTFTGNTATGNGIADIEGLTIPANTDLSWSGEITLTENQGHTQPWIAGDNIQFSGTVVNSGPETASSTMVSHKMIYPDGQIVSFPGDLFGGNGYDFSSGETRNAAQGWFVLPEFAAGQYTIILTIDPDDLVSETDETNNVLSINFQIDEIPTQDTTELGWVGGITFTENNGHTEPWTLGDNVQFSATAINEGSAIAYTLEASYQITDPNGTVVFSSINLYGGGYNLTPGETRNTAQGFYFDPNTNYVFGTYTMTMTIDSNGIIPENNETNNVLQTTFVLKEKEDTCFSATGYSAPWAADPYAASRTVHISGKLAPQQDGACVLSNDLILIGKLVTITAEKDGMTKTSTVTTTSPYDLFSTNLTFADESDVGNWTITYSFAGDEDYNPSNNHTYTLAVPEILTPPDPVPVVTVPDDIIVYSGNAEFSFAADPINVYKYSGTTVYTHYPQPTVSMTGVGPIAVNYAVSASDIDSNGWASGFSGPTCDKPSGSLFGIGTTTVTCTATDFSGGDGTASFDVTVIANSISGSPTCTPGPNPQLAIGSTIISCQVENGTGPSPFVDSFAMNVQQKTPLTDAECREAAGSGHDSDSVFVCQYPFDVTVEEGQRLVWVDTQPWQGFYRHSITSVDGLFDHSDAGKVDMLPSAWGGIGTYSFYDKLHPTAPSWMHGSITIAPADTTAPNLTVPSDMTISTEDVNGTPTVTYTVTATDDRSVTSGPTCDKPSGSMFGIGTTTVTCTASDAAGNSGTTSFNVIVEYTFVDTTAPGFASFDNIELSTTNPAGTVVNYSLPSATDNVAVTSGPTCDKPSGSMFGIGTTTVTCTASDAAGNSGSMSFTVGITQTIIDNTAPAITITSLDGDVGSQTKIATNSTGVGFGFEVSAVDNIGVSSGPTCTAGSQSLPFSTVTSITSTYLPTNFPIGTSIIACTASDDAGNSGTSIFTLTVQPQPVETPAEPTVANISGTMKKSSGSLDFTNGEGWIYFESSDNIETNVEVANDGTYSVTLAPGTYEIRGDYYSDDNNGTFGTVYDDTYTEYDYRDNSMEISGDMEFDISFQTYRLDGTVKDSSADPIPNVKIKLNSNHELSSDSYLSSEVEVYTNQQGQYSIDVVPHGFDDSFIVTPPENSGLLKKSLTEKIEGSKILDVELLRIDDVAGTSTVVSIGDITPPIFTPSQNIVVDATAANGAIVKYETPEVKDEGGISYGPACEPKSGIFFPIGSTTVTCIAKDVANNQGATAFTVTVKSKITAPTVVPTTVSVNIGKPFYQNDDAIFITGAANPIINEKVNLEIRDPLSNLVGIEQADVEEFGAYTAIVFPSSLWNVNGTYSTSASYGTSIDTMNFDFEILPEVIQSLPTIVNPTKIDLKLSNCCNFKAGDTMIIDAKLDAGTGHSIILDIDGPGGQLLLQPLNTDSNGHVNLNYALGKNLVSGTYVVSAKSSNANYDLSEEIEILIAAPVPDLTIKEVRATAEDGSDVEKYDAGDLAYFSTNLNTNSTTPVLVTVNVFDSEQNTLGVGFFKSTIGEGDSEIILGFELPEDLVSGVAQVYTNIFTDWPDKGGVPVSDEIKASIEIVGIPAKKLGTFYLDYEEFPTNTSFTATDIVNQATSYWKNSPPPNVYELFEGKSYANSQLPFSESFTNDLQFINAPTEDSNLIHIEWVKEYGGGKLGHALPVTIDGFDYSNIQIQFGDSFCNGVWESYTEKTVRETLIHELGHVLGFAHMDDASDIMYHSSSPSFPIEYENCVFDDSITPPPPETVIEESEPIELVEPVPEPTPVPEPAVEVINAVGSAVPGCEETNECFIPYTTKIVQGDTVTWTNPDDSLHIAASGNPSNGPDGVFDSGPMFTNDSFSFTFNDVGTYDYFCLVHPWMIGQIIVSPGSSENTGENIGTVNIIPQSESSESTMIILSPDDSDEIVNEIIKVVNETVGIDETVVFVLKPEDVSDSANEIVQIINETVGIDEEVITKISNEEESITENEIIKVVNETVGIEETVVFVLKPEETALTAITTENDSYKTGDTILINGTVPSGKSSITIDLKNPAGALSNDLSSLKNIPVVNNSFETTILADANSFFTMPGIYSLSIENSESDVKTTFDYSLVITGGTGSTNTTGTSGPDDNVGIGETVTAIVSAFNFEREPSIPYPVDASMAKHLETMDMDCGGDTVIDFDNDNNLVLFSAQPNADGDRSICKFDSDGELLTNKLIQLGDYGLFYRSGPYPFAIDSENNMYLGYGDYSIDGTNTNNGNIILRFNDNGDILNEISLQEYDLRLSRDMSMGGLVIDSENNIFTFADNYDSSNHNIPPELFLVKISNTGELLSSVKNDRNLFDGQNAHYRYIVGDKNDNIYVHSTHTLEYVVDGREIRTVDKMSLIKFDNNLNVIDSFEKDFSMVSNKQDNHRPEALMGVDENNYLYFQGSTFNIDRSINEKLVNGARITELQVYEPTNNFSDLKFVGSVQRYLETEMSQFTYRYDTEILVDKPGYSHFRFDQSGKIYFQSYGMHIFSTLPSGNEIIIKDTASDPGCAEWESNWVGRDTPYRAFNCIAPYNAQINIGESVTWKNEDNASHAITSGTPESTNPGSVFSSGNLGPNGTFTFTFNSEGTYEYFDMVNPWVKGVVTVVGGN